ncbi:MAG: helix-turn-helix domain-containing protein [Myxococcota bacterium]|nr:helix-turn-helix domain-containing protein [Myxococcota bacterium]
MRWSELGDEQCAVARFLAVLGDRWALLILSDSFLGVRRFETFMERLGIPRTTLTRRLETLCEHGVLERVAYQERPERHEYRLTAKGLDLYPVMMAMTQWGNRYYADEGGPPILFEHARCGADFVPEVACSECGEVVAPREVRARTRPPMPHLPPVRRGPVREEEGGARDA